MAFLLRAIGGVEEVHPAHGRPMFSLLELQSFVGGYIETVRTIGGLWLGRPGSRSCRAACCRT
jgi:hypothetical protein